MASNNPELQDDITMSTSESDYDPGRASNDDESEDFSVQTDELIENLMPGAWAEDDEDDDEGTVSPHLLCSHEANEG